MRLGTIHLMTLGLALAFALGARAREPGASEEPMSVPSAKPAIGLERLLRPPELVPARVVRYGGKGREVWSARFSSARDDINDLEARIDAAQVEIREVSPGDWGFSPSGAGAPVSPDVLRIRAEIRREKESLEAARQRLRDLDVEASLAGVPDEWKQPE